MHKQIGAGTTEVKILKSSISSLVCTRCQTNVGDLFFDMSKKLVQEEVIARFREVHGNKFDYSKVNFKKVGTKVCIICHEKDENGVEHGEFWQTPNNHFVAGDVLNAD